ncbi:Arc family DNA-binding protein [Xenorhabdus sp. XENO-10]|uniref:Arc family DNA-binding protein n=1 Tax=Xenorhabdus yunnanensis TaxID=3025878 RepID=A0ABT5LJM9_9GAMM|nr:Arc family DNA-binding protein [Xenorhabdus yunnanensis]MDC9591326.1 Arc family DNA-binding protein [Xenorhabdus yunnanensis]
MSKIERLPQVNIRMPNDMRNSLKYIANVQDRSVNYVIVKALEEYISKNGETPTAGTVRASKLSKTE